MAAKKPPDNLWDEVGRLLGGEEECCFAYTEEELASFAEHKMRRRAARVLEQHLQICSTCSAIVGELREQLAAQAADEGRERSAAKSRPIAARPPLRWEWGALATVAATAVLLLAIGHWWPRPIGGAPSLGPSRPSTVAQAPISTQPLPHTNVRPPARLATRPAPLSASAVPAVPSTRGHAVGRRNHPRPAAGTTLAAGQPNINELGALPHLSLLEEKTVFDVEVHVDAQARPDLVNELSADELRAPATVRGMEERLFVSPENSPVAIPQAPPAAPRTVAKP